MFIQFKDPYLQLIINATVKLVIKNELVNYGYIVGPLHIELRNCNGLCNQIQSLLIKEHQFAIIRVVEQEDVVHIYTSTQLIDVDVPILCSIVIEMEYFVFTDLNIVYGCIESIFKEILPVIPISDLKGIHNSIQPFKPMTISDVVLGWLKF